MKLEGETELDHIKWARWKRELLNTAEYNPNDWDKLSQYQKKWTADVLNTLKALEQTQ